MESNNRKRTIAISSLLLTILALGSIAGIILYRNEPVVLQGRIECERTTISGKIIGRVGNLYVNEGDTVAPGDTLAALTSPELEAELTSASAMEQVAQYQNIKIDAGTRKEVVKMLKEAYDAAFANYTLSATTLERSTRLYKDSVITSQRMDEIKALHKNAEAALNSARLQYEMALEGAQREDKESARAMVNAARGGVDAIASLLEDKHLTSPTSGEIGSIFLNKGELVMPGSPLMDILNTDSCYVIINVREDYLSRFYIGSEFIGTLPALDNFPIAFQVYYINPLGSFANWSSTKDGNTYNLITFQIKARPVITDDTPESSAGIKMLRPGMSVMVKLATI